ncbi:MAG: imidazolonepropionase-like amidohydrolase [Planctomycetota bacterium]|jgi:imidazolonepropionase-like amidohydrolase
MKNLSNRIPIRQTIRMSIAILAAMFFSSVVADPHSSTSKGFALTGVNIIGHGAGVVIIRDGRIEAITDKVPSLDLEVIDFKGRYIVPAFIDSHVHLAIGFTVTQLAQGGIAAAVDLSAPLHFLAANHAPLDILFSGPMVTASRGYPTQSWGGDGYGLETNGVASVRAAVDFLVASGARVIKMPVGDTTGGGAIPGMEENKSTLNDEELKAIVDQAHSHGMRVAAHAITDSAAMRAAKAGADVLAHTPTVPLSQATVAAWSNRALISTLAAFKNVPVAVDNLRRLREAGTTILYGTDLGYTQIPAINLEELEQLRKAGLDNDAILASVTETPAKYWGFEGFGRLRPGSRANFLILDADPGNDLSSLTRPVAIYLDGIKLETTAVPKDAE